MLPAEESAYLRISKKAGVVGLSRARRERRKGERKRGEGGEGEGGTRRNKKEAGNIS